MDQPTPASRPRPRPRPAGARTESDGDTKTIVAPKADTAKPTVTPARTRDGQRRWIVIAAIIATIALAVVDGVLLKKQSDRGDRVAAINAVNTSATEAVAAAKRDVPTFLSYDYRTLDRDLGAAKALTTGSFKTEYSQLLDTVVAPAAKSRKIMTKASVADAGVVQAAKNTVTVLVFINQTTSSAAAKTPRIDGSRATVVLSKVGDAWRIARLTPV